MKVYHYNQAGVFIGATNAIPDPLENPKADPEGRFLCPANATFLEPPEAPADCVPCFVRNQWTLVPVQADKPQTDNSVPAPQPEKPKFALYFRKAEGLDSKIVRGMSVLHSPPSAPNPDHGLIVFDSEPKGWNDVNERGVPLKKIVDNKIVARDASDVARDAQNATFISELCNSKVLKTFTDLTGNGYSLERHHATYSRIMYVAANIDGSADDQEVAVAKNKLKAYKKAYDKMEELYKERDAALAKLDLA